MQRRASDFTGYSIEAIDGTVGHISDILFEDQNWKLRWFVVNTGSWLIGRQILIHPDALQPADIRNRAFPVSLTKCQVEASPDLRSDQPVSLQMDQDLSDYYGYSSLIGDGLYGGLGLGLLGDGTSRVITDPRLAAPSRDDHQLLSIGATTGFQIHALDGDIGHLDDFLVDDEDWTVTFAIVATKNWGFGKHVLVSPSDIQATNVFARYVPVNLTRYAIKCRTSWQEPDWSHHAGP